MNPIIKYSIIGVLVLVVLATGSVETKRYIARKNIKDKVLTLIEQKAPQSSIDAQIKNLSENQSLLTYIGLSNSDAMNPNGRQSRNIEDRRGQVIGAPEPKHSETCRRFQDLLKFNSSKCDEQKKVPGGRAVRNEYDWCGDAYQTMDTLMELGCYGQ